MNSSGNSPDSQLAQDPRLRPTPDYGTLGPTSDVVPDTSGGQRARPGRSATPIRSGPVIAIAVGLLLGVFVATSHKAVSHPAGTFSARPATAATTPVSATSAKDPARLDRMRPQTQAETLLELAVGNSEGAVDQISSRVDRWHGKLTWSPRLANLTTAALDSRDMRVRQSGIEVQLAAYGLTKDSSNLDTLIRDVGSPKHARKIWALWALGGMANRGVESDRVVEILTAHLKDSDADSRRWAVEALALVGTDSTIPILLQTMHNDPSPLVRERAACSLAESGLLTHDQRMTAVPQLLAYSDDPSLDAQTHGWAFQALGDITGQRLPNDSAAWRQWYDRTSGQ